MYNLQRARHRADRNNGRWKPIDLASAYVTTMATQYGDIYLYIETPGPGEPVIRALRWDNVLNLLNGVNPGTTLTQWLADMGNKTLPFDETLPNESERLVRYAQAWHCGYNAIPVGRTGHINQGGSKFHKEDLVLTHPVHKPQRIRDYSLLSINGYFHLADWTDAGVRIIDGNTTVRKGNDNQIGIYSFETIGQLKFHPITVDMLSKQNAVSTFWDATYVTLPETVDLTNKTVLMVVGGYLLVNGRSYTRVGARTWRVEFGNMMFLDRFIESNRNLDLSSLGLAVDPDNASKLVLDELKNDDVIKAYMTLSQSFMVVLDSPTFFQDYVPVEYLGLPGRFIDETNARIPMVGSYGRMLDYHVIGEEGDYVYCTRVNYRHNYDANHRKWQEHPVVDGGRYPAHPFVHETAYFRYLGVDG